MAKQLLTRTVEILDGWDCTQAGLFTFSNSEKHVGLYQKFGFWPRFLTALMSKPARASWPAGYTRFSSLSNDAKSAAIDACAQTTGLLYEGLDVRREIDAVAAQSLGEVLLAFDDAGVGAFAVCHAGAGSEAGSESCYIKFGCARRGPGVELRFAQLLDACEAFSRECGAGEISAGVNTSRREAYGAMLDRGFRIEMFGVAMHRPNVPGFCRGGVYAIDDWR